MEDAVGSKATGSSWSAKRISAGGRSATPHTVATALREHSVHQLEVRLIVNSRWWDQGLVIASTIGMSLDAWNVVRHFKAVLKRAKLPDMRWHDLRHTRASLLLAQKVPPRVVIEALEHSQISMTTRYSHDIAETKREVADQMERLRVGAGSAGGERGAGGCQKGRQTRRGPVG